MISRRGQPPFRLVAQLDLLGAAAELLGHRVENLPRVPVLLLLLGPRFILLRFPLAVEIAPALRPAPPRNSGKHGRPSLDN
jgi:hypothetical protein